MSLAHSRNTKTARSRPRAIARGREEDGRLRRDRGMSADSRGPRRTSVPAASPCHSCERAKSGGGRRYSLKGMGEDEEAVDERVEQPRSATKWRRRVVARR